MGRPWAESSISLRQCTGVAETLMDQEGWLDAEGQCLLQCVVR